VERWIGGVHGICTYTCTCTIPSHPRSDHRSRMDGPWWKAQMERCDVTVQLNHTSSVFSEEDMGVRKRGEGSRACVYVSEHRD
jgi:hypothetical protein